MRSLKLLGLVSSPETNLKAAGAVFLDVEDSSAAYAAFLPSSVDQVSESTQGKRLLDRLANIRESLVTIWQKLKGSRFDEPDDIELMETATSKFDLREKHVQASDSPHPNTIFEESDYAHSALSSSSVILVSESTQAKTLLDRLANPREFLMTILQGLKESRFDEPGDIELIENAISKFDLKEKHEQASDSCLRELFHLEVCLGRYMFQSSPITESTRRLVDFAQFKVSDHCKWAKKLNLSWS